MTAIEMAKEFVKTMNPELVTDGTANFAIYEFPLHYDGLHLEVAFLDESDAIGEDESPFRTAIDVVAGSCTYMGMYTFAETMTDVEAIAGGIQYLLDKLEEYYEVSDK